LLCSIAGHTASLSSGDAIANQMPADADLTLGLNSPVTNCRPGISTNR
jgi:hypothetical protein